MRPVKMFLCRQLRLVILILHAGQCQDFRLFVTDYQGKVYSLNAVGDLVDTFDIRSHASGIAVDSPPFDDDQAPTIVYGTDEAIYRLALNGSETEHLYGSFEHLTERIVIEPTNRDIYYTAFIEDKDNSSFIAVLTPQGDNTAIITELDSPRGLALHPHRRQLFWTDWGSPPHIGSSNLDGSDKRVIVSSDLSWPNGLVIDFRDNMLYWSDGKLERIERSGLSGESREIVLHIPGVHLMSLLIADGSLYITNWNAPEITRMSLTNTTDKELFATIVGGNRLIAMAVYPNNNLLHLRCPPLKTPEHAILNDTAVSQGTVVSVTCTKGYSLIGSKILICQPYGFWNSDVPVCKKDCTPLNTGPGLVFSVIATKHGSTVMADCEAGYYLVGDSSVSCIDGVWIPTEPTCRKITPVIRLCPKAEDKWGTVWEEAFPEQTVTLPCIETGSKGNITRKCSSNGKWLLPMYNCLRADVRRLVEQMESVKTNPSSSGVSQVLNDLANVTTSHMDNHNLYSGEIESVTQVLESLANVSNNKLNVTEDQSKLLLKAASNVIDKNYQHSWQVLSEKQGGGGAAGVLRSVDTMAKAMAKSLAQHNSSWMTVAEDNIALKVSKLSPSQRDIKFPDSSLRKDWLNDTRTGLSAVLKPNSGSESDAYSATIYRTFDGLMPSSMPAQSLIGPLTVELAALEHLKHPYRFTMSLSKNGERTGNTKLLNTHIVSLQIISNQSLLSSSVVLAFQHEKSNFTGPECSYWSLQSHRWETAGCQVRSTNNTATVCECNHLTNFAVLMSPWTQASVDLTAIEVISIIGCSVSVVCLILTAATHLILWRYIKSDRGVILINICLALTGSYILFLAGVNQTDIEEACTAIAILLQYIYLVVFCLMLAEGIEIVMTVHYVFANKTRIKWTLPLAWGIPAVIVGISMGVTKLEGYGTEHFCWLSLDNGLIWAFVGPALLIIAANAIILMLVVRTMCRTKAFGEKSDMEKFKCSLRCLGVLLPIMGCTWILGILYVNDRTAWIQYVFAICNGLQGFFIFLFHVCLNKQLHVAIKRRRKLYKDSVSTTNTMSTKARPTIRKTSLFSSPLKPESEPVRLIAVEKTVSGEDSDDCSGLEIKASDESAFSTCGRFRSILRASASMNSLQKAACEEIDASAAELHELSQEIWNHPEENFREIFAHGLLTNFLEKRGLYVERNYVVNTGFRSVTGSREEGPHVAVLCEYDALPEIGHACGHNLIAEAGVAAGLGIIAAFKKNGKPLGKLTILGTPAEEGGGGKINMIDAKFFDDVDVALMAHPSPVNRYVYNSLAIERVIVKYFGKAAHASMFPWDGVNALDAAVLCYQNVSCMRQQLKPSWRVHGVIKSGGVKANIIPEFTELVFYARTPTKEELEVLMSKLEQCLHSAAAATGCTIEISTEGPPYLNHINNKVLSDLYFDNARAVGIDFDKHGVKPGQTVPSGSTDMGNVSHVVPSIHPTFYIGTDVASHTRAFAVAAGDPKAQQYTLSVGKALAMTAVDVLTKPELLQNIKREYDMNH